MPDKTQICNMALTKIGQTTISIITADTPTTNKLRTIYDQVLDEALTAGPEKGWKFATTRVTVSVDAAEPDSEYEYRYAVPNQCLRIVKVHTEGIDYTDWVREGQYILTNGVDDEINLTYVQRITNEGYFPSHFIKVLYTMLAYHLAFNIVQSKAHANAIYEELHIKVLPKAIALDEQEQYVKEESSAWVDAGRGL